MNLQSTACPWYAGRAKKQIQDTLFGGHDIFNIAQIIIMLKTKNNKLQFSLTSSWMNLQSTACPWYAGRAKNKIYTLYLMLTTFWDIFNIYFQCSTDQYYENNDKTEICNSA